MRSCSSFGKDYRGPMSPSKTEDVVKEFESMRISEVQAETCLTYFDRTETPTVVTLRKVL